MSRTPAWLSAALSLALVLVWAQPAQAAVTLDWNDSFETVPTNWTFEHAGEGEGTQIQSTTWSHSGTHYMSLSASKEGAFSSVGRLAVIPPASVVCTLSAMISPSGFGSDGHVRLNVEVINPSNWTYHAVAHADFTTPVTYQQAAVTWIPSASFVYLRFSVLGSGTHLWISVRVDDAHLYCYNFTS